MFGERLKSLRLAEGLSQEELGKRMGVTKQTISNWENENITPALDMFVNLVEYFQTTPNHMLGYEMRTGIDVSGLTDKEVLHIVQIVSDMKEFHQSAEK